MQLNEIIKNTIHNVNPLERITNPASERLTFITDKEAIFRYKARESKIWYYGDSNELLNFYTQANAISLFDNPIYNRNTRNLFWSRSVAECNIKRVHSGVPNAIISTISNIIGVPDIQAFVIGKDNATKVDVSEVWKKIEEQNDFAVKLSQQGRPLTCACGYGAWKVNIAKDVSRTPILEFYDAEDVVFSYDCGILTGIIFKTYYSYDKHKYVLLEYRYVYQGDSYIKYQLYRFIGDGIDEVEFAPIEEVPELANIEDKVIRGLNKITAVPSRYFYDAINPQYGRSIFDGKIDLFDDLDLTLSQESQTVKVSTPVEYYSPDTIDRGPNGETMLPTAFNRQFIKKAGVPDGEGNMTNDIITTQPELNFDKYSLEVKSKLDLILTGVLSPATLGIEVAKKDNAEAQREKEKITIQTRNNIIAAETKMLRQLVELSLLMQEYIGSDGTITLDRKYDITIKYNEFANPSFESELQILGPSWVNGEISTKQYVDLLWGDKLSEKDKNEEIAYLDKQKQQNEFSPEDLGGLYGNENATIGNSNRPSIAGEQEGAIPAKE